jgi:divalent metal cation (Fe/Co/Zn/Cd) transporter
MSRILTVASIVGSAAPQGLVDRLVEIGRSHHPSLSVDYIRAYYFGARFVVEMEIVMPISSTLREVHDISLELQHKLEALEPVERAFVHVDYEQRDQPEHRTERPLCGLPVLREESVEI